MVQFREARFADLSHTSSKDSTLTIRGLKSQALPTERLGGRKLGCMKLPVRVHENL